MPIDQKPSQNEDEYFARQNAELLKARRAALDAQRAEQERHSHYMRCPKCGGQLAEKLFHNVKVDVCQDCKGTWFDAGEIEMLTQVERGQLRSFLGGLIGPRR